MTIGNVYLVIGIEADMYRILDDSNDPCLYDPAQFEIIDGVEPDFWVTHYGNEKERYSYPESWGDVGFFEDYHDNVEEIVNQFWFEYKELFGIGENV